MIQIFKLQIDKNRIYGLDILRAFAILFVVIGHANNLLPDNIRNVVKFVELDGVTIFFVLSGYLIGRILIKILSQEGPTVKTLFNFWIRRWLRTLPNYYLILFTLTILNLIFNDKFGLYKIKKYLFFSQNLFHKHPSFFGEAWSLSVEEWFYLVVPIILFGSIYLLKLPLKKVVINVSIFILLFVTFYRLINFYTLDIKSSLNWDLLFRKQVITRLDSLMYGIIGAYISIYYNKLWVKHQRKSFLLGIIIFMTADLMRIGNLLGTGIYYYVFYFSTISIATLLFLPLLSNLKKGQGLIFKTLTYISLISYSMYLINFSLVKGWIFQNINLPEYIDWRQYIVLVVKYFTFLFLTITLSIIIYKYFELPFMKLRDKFNLKKRSTLLTNENKTSQRITRKI